MSQPVRLTAEAVANQNEIADWIAGHSLDGALRWLDAFEDAIRRIGDTPEAFSLAPENGYSDRELRNAFFGTPKGRLFRAIFFVAEQSVVVTHLRGPDQRPLTSEEVESVY